ncbi:MAG: response regulator transcription factor [Gammaproteobacteria bacterium]|nr:response regulator transcription factor [Gammaproteobacteria bacterium]MDH5729289.1 response regulator transcription factor [Gammaproteobacteria bacterium]
MTKIAALIDDHPLYAEAITGLVESIDPQWQVKQFSDLKTVAEIRQALQHISMIFLDLTLPSMQGIESFSYCRKLFPETPIVVITAIQDHHIARRLITLGAKGYISKSLDTQPLTLAITAVLNGDSYFPALSDTLSDTETKLTERQLEILDGLSNGQSNKQIAYDLGISEGTVRVHTATIFKLLNVRNRTSAVREAQKLGVIGLPSVTC